MFHCPQCGAAFKEGAKFCHICGYKVPEEPSQPIQEPIEEPIAENPESTKTSDAGNEPINVETFTDVKTDEVFSAVKSGNIFKRAINIMIKPKQEWEDVAEEKPRIPMLIMGYALIFSLIPLLALMVNNSFWGSIRFGIHFTLSGTIFGVLQGFLYMLAALATIIVTAVIINALAPAFKTEKNLGRAMQLTTYSFTPMFFWCRSLPDSVYVVCGFPGGTVWSVSCIDGTTHNYENSEKYPDWLFLRYYRHIVRNIFYDFLDEFGHINCTISFHLFNPRILTSEYGYP
jgi:uncharacterized Zn finger protein (UPF0148 family)